MNGHGDTDKIEALRKPGRLRNVFATKNPKLIIPLAALILCLLSIHYVFETSKLESSLFPAFNATEVYFEEEDPTPPQCVSETWSQLGNWVRKPGLQHYYEGRWQNVLMPLSEEQQCLMAFGEWEQYCTGVDENIQRTNHLLSWDYTTPNCTMREFNPEEVVRSMIEEGGWSLIGDSLTRSHVLAISCQLSPHLVRLPAATEEIYLQYPEANIQNAESPIIYTLSPSSPLWTDYPSHTYPGTNTSIPLLTFYRSDFLVSFDRMRSMLPKGVIYDENTPYKQDWTYNLDIANLSQWLAAPEHNIKTIIINTGTHYNSGQLGGGVTLDALNEVSRSAMEYVTSQLSDNLRSDQTTWFRASVSGHSDGKGICQSTMPLNETVRIKYFWYNWHSMDVFNVMWKTYLEEMHWRGQMLNIRYLDISRPSMLRPDAHKKPANGEDCLHFCLIANVVQQWTYIMWNEMLPSISANRDAPLE